MPTAITWKHTIGTLPPPWTLENKIEIFYERFFGWQLNIADIISNGPNSIPHSDFASLHVCFSYFEMIGKYLTGDLGKRSSSELFEIGVKSVFPDVDAWPKDIRTRILGRLYGGTRCGLYHAAMPSSGIGVHRGDFVFCYVPESNILLINPGRLPGTLIAHLRHYRDRLNDPKETELRNNFQKRFDIDNGLTEPNPGDPKHIS